VERPAIQHALSVQRLLPPDPWLPLLSSMAFWLLASLLVGLLANRLPQRWLQQPANTRHGKPPGIRVWKRWIPDFGGALPGGVRKANLVQRDPASLRRLLRGRVRLSRPARSCRRHRSRSIICAGKERRRRVTISWGGPNVVCWHKRINSSRKFIGKIG
jgi:hypothetical protein